VRKKKPELNFKQAQKFVFVTPLPPPSSLPLFLTAGSGREN